MGSCEALIAERDWGRTPLGHRETWPTALRVTVQNLLHTKQPTLLFWGPDWIQFYNDAFVPSFGQGKHPTAMGQSARDCWADAWPVIGAQLEAVVARGEPAWHEDTLVPIFRNGRMEEVFWTYSYSPAHDETGRIAGVLVVCTEMTGRVLAARRLDAVTRLGMALSGCETRDAVFDTLRALAKSCPHDIPFVEVTDRSAGRALSPPRPIDTWPEPVTHTFVARAHLTSLEFGLSPRLPADTGYLGFLGQLAEQVDLALRRIDETDARYRADAERAAMLVALTDANQAKDEFLAMLGHELRNPLAPIVAAVELMKFKDPVTTPERAAIERQLQHVVRLVDDLLDVSRIASGKLELARRTIELGEVITMAVEASRTLIDQRRHTLSLDVAPGLTVNADATRLVQVISNLVVNAARYTPPGGKIRVIAKRDAANVLVQVQDNGRGIPADLVPRIFDLFVQGKRTADRAEGGLGLGLAIVKNLVIAHGGTVSVESPGENQGATFSLRLPAVDALDSETTTASKNKRSTAPRNVLLVDDNEDAVHLLGEVARGVGHVVVVVHHPEAALERIREFAPDVAVLDIGLPQLDGYELGKRIRAHHPHCRIVALTGYGQARDRERSAEAGFTAHLVKPVRIDVFLELLQ